MAKSKNNVLTYGLSGIMGELMVFRQLNGQTIVANKPRERTTPLTANQLAALANFKKAARYAKGVHNDPIRKAEYSLRLKKGLTVFVRAITDYLTPPEVADANLSNYEGQVGDTLSVDALDDFIVQSVHVAIRDAADLLIEEGEAVQNPANEVEWTYTVTQANASVPGTKVSFTAYDLPGNATTLVATK